MSIVPASSLSGGELRLLGNNLVPESKPRKLMTAKLTTRAVNRSLAVVGERVKHLHSRPVIP